MNSRQWLSITQDNGELMAINLDNVSHIADVYDDLMDRTHARVVMVNHDHLNFVNQRAADLMQKMGVVIPAYVES